MQEAPSAAKDPAISKQSQHVAADGGDPSWDGLPLEDYAREAALSEAEVWKRLRRGDLIGRTQRGRLFVYAREAAVPPEHPVSAGAPSQNSGTFGAWVTDNASRAALGEPAGGTLPPLPAGGDTARQGAAGGGFMALTGERTSSPEMALLLDHLSLAKEENREILRLTQHSIQKVTELTDKIVEMKDTVIEAKDAQILALMQQLDAKEERIKKLAGQNEDLEMLARTLADEAR